MQNENPKNDGVGGQTVKPIKMLLLYCVEKKLRFRNSERKNYAIQAKELFCSFALKGAHEQFCIK